MGKFKSIKVLDLFAGAGGFSLGFHNAGFHPGVLVDNCQQAVESLDVNFSHLGGRALQRDLSSLSPDVLKRDLIKGGHSGTIDMIIGGPPCQGWSRVGRGKIKSLGLRDEGAFSDPRNLLYKKFLGFVGYFQPLVCVMENVPGMLSHSGQNIAELVAIDLKSQGYQVSWTMLNAVNYGVPQSRERLFFVGIRQDLNATFKFPKWQTARGKRMYPEVTVKDAIGDLPVLRNGAREWIRDYKPARMPSEYGKKMRELADPSLVFDHVCRAQNGQDLQAFKLMKEGGIYRDLPEEFKRYRDDIFDDKYRKLRWDKPSWCVTAHLSRDCYSHIHPSQTRTISIREAARLQSFPDSFYFAGCMGDKFKLIGNAVAPLMAEKIATELMLQIFSKTLPNRRAPFERDKRTYPGQTL